MNIRSDTHPIVGRPIRGTKKVPACEHMHVSQLTHLEAQQWLQSNDSEGDWSGNLRGQDLQSAVYDNLRDFGNGGQCGQVRCFIREDEMSISVWNSEQLTKRARHRQAAKLQYVKDVILPSLIDTMESGDHESLRIFLAADDYYHQCIFEAIGTVSARFKVGSFTYVIRYYRGTPSGIVPRTPDHYEIEVAEFFYDLGKLTYKGNS